MPSEPAQWEAPPNGYWKVNWMGPMITLLEFLLLVLFSEMQEESSLMERDYKPRLVSTVVAEGITLYHGAQIVTRHKPSQVIIESDSKVAIEEAGDKSKRKMWKLSRILDNLDFVLRELSSDMGGGKQ